MKYTKSLLLVSLLIGAALLPEVALAESWGNRAAAMNTEAQQGIPLLGSVIFFIGIVIAGVSLYKFKAWKDNPQQTPLSTPIVGLIVAVGMMYMPTMIGNTTGTLLGEDAQTQGADGSGLTNLGR